MSAVKRLSMAERKKEIMLSASRVILEKGFANTSMEDIVAGTTLSKGGVYHYYSSVVEIFKDIMLRGIDYRNEIIKKNLGELKKGYEKEFMAKQVVDKILDSNPYIPLYVEFLVAQKRNEELRNLMLELQQSTKEKFKNLLGGDKEYQINESMFKFFTDFLNAMILGANVLSARETFTANRDVLEKIVLLIFEEKGKESDNEGIQKTV